VTQDHRPAWLLVAVGAGLTAFFVVAGCTRVSSLRSELTLSSLTSRVLGSSAAAVERSPEVNDSVQLTSAALPRLAFASVDAVADELDEADRPAPMNGLCPANMASVDDRFCVDKYEASLVEMLPGGDERPFPFYMPVDGHKVRAVSEKGVYPQGYISGKEAGAACKASGKRLCKPQEWKTACKGPEKQQYGYGSERKPGTCNDNGRSPIGYYWAPNARDGSAFSSNKIMNDPQLNQLPGTLAETGSHESCSNGYGVYDMVGNIHEWVDDPNGTFQGGYYLDVEKNGEGCGYRTDAHEVWYHDYSTGFRCCSDVGQ
jgi:formylglycine-generating enzyme